MPCALAGIHLDAQARLTRGGYFFPSSDSSLRAPPRQCSWHVRDRLARGTVVLLSNWRFGTPI
jgi:hypothetical protein